LQFKKNEKGGALLLVLMVIIVFSLLGMGLLTMNVSSAKQINKKEISIQVRHLAEMGILHYKVQVLDIILKHNNVVDNIRKTGGLQMIQKINEENAKFCEELTSPQKVFNVINSYNPNKYNVKTRKVSYCNSNEVIIYITAEGKDINNNKKTIDADFRVFLPTNIGGGTGTGTGTGTPPVAPINDVKIVNGTYPISTGTYKQNESSLYIKGTNSRLEIKNGNGSEKGSRVTIKKDLYVEGHMEIGTQSCVAIQGNFHAKSLNLKNKTFLFIYGDANFPNVFNIHNQHAQIYVTGDVYINGVKQQPKPFNNVPLTEVSNGCSLPGTPENTDTAYPTVWKMDGNIKATYK
jgi:hypothetical protein